MPRTVVITGGDKGIGAAISRAFHALGERVVIASRTDSGLAGLLGDRAEFIKCDVRSVDAIQRFADRAGEVHVLVNNAGFSRWSALADATESFWDEMIDTNLKGTFFVTRAVAARMSAGGCIINISSLAGKRGSANNSVYCASKFGVNGLTQSLAKELGPRGIRVNAICPVYVQTDGLGRALDEATSPARGEDVAGYLEEFAASQAALGRLPTADEIGDMCVFLASASATAVTGQCINVDCGVLPS